MKFTIEIDEDGTVRGEAEAAGLRAELSGTVQGVAGERVGVVLVEIAKPPNANLADAIRALHLQDRLSEVLARCGGLLATTGAEARSLAEGCDDHCAACGETGCTLRSLLEALRTAAKAKGAGPHDAHNLGDRPGPGGHGLVRSVRPHTN